MCDISQDQLAILTEDEEEENFIYPTTGKFTCYRG